MKTPTEQDAMAIAQAILQQSVQSIQRFPTGLCHYVYDVALANSQQVIIRIAHAYTQALLAGGVFWSEQLRSQDVPLPQILHADLSSTEFPFAFVVLERLPGTDLGHVYDDLTLQEKQGIATALVQIQARVHQLPLGPGFGYARSLDELTLYSSWTELVEASLNSSGKRLETNSLVDYQCMSRVRKALNQFRGYLDAVKSIAFLDDTTTKNVLIHQGKLSGIRPLAK